MKIQYVKFIIFFSSLLCNFCYVVHAVQSASSAPGVGPQMMKDDESTKEAATSLISSQELLTKAMVIADKLFNQQQAVEKIIEQSQLQKRDLGEKIDLFAKNFGQKKGNMQAIIQKLENYVELRLSEFTEKITNAKEDEIDFITSIIEKITGVSESLVKFKDDLEKNNGEYQKILELQNQIYQQDQTLNEKQFAYAQLLSRVNKLKSKLYIEEKFDVQKQHFSEIERLQGDGNKLVQEIQAIKNDLSMQIQNGIQSIESGLVQLEQQLKGIESRIDVIAKMINDQSTAQETKMIKVIQENNKNNLLKKSIEKISKESLSDHKMFNWIKKYIVDLKSKILKIEVAKSDAPVNSTDTKKEEVVPVTTTLKPVESVPAGIKTPVQEVKKSEQEVK